MRARPEYEYHQAVAAFLDMALPPFPECWWTSIGHGVYLGEGTTTRRGKKVPLSIIRGAMLKSIGVKKGVHDVLIIAPWLNLWVELKDIDGRLSEEQKTVRDFFLTMPNWDCAVARSLEELEKVLLDRKFPLRLKVQAGKMTDTIGRVASGKSRFTFAQRGPSRAALRNSALYQGPIKK